MAANKVQYASASLSTERNRIGRSSCVWSRGGGAAFGIEQVREDNNNGDLLHEPFLNWGGTAVASNLGNYVGNGSCWHSYEMSGASIKLSGTDNPTIPGAAGVGFGVIKLVSGATAHNSVCMELGGAPNASGTGLGSFGVGAAAAVTLPAGNSLPKLFFEARVRFNAITAIQSMFIGLAKPNQTSGANTMFNGSDALQEVNHIGFYIDGTASVITGGTGAKIFGTYGINSAAPTVVGSGGIPSSTVYPGQSLATAVPGLLTDFTKLGFVFDPTNAAQPLSFWQDGVLLGQQGLGTQGTLTGITAANWPSNVPLNAVVYFQAAGAGGASVELDVDWIDVGQILNVE